MFCNEFKGFVNSKSLFVWYTCEAVDSQMDSVADLQSGYLQSGCTGCGFGTRPVHAFRVST